MVEWQSKCCKYIILYISNISIFSFFQWYIYYMLIIYAKDYDLKYNILFKILKNIHLYLFFLEKLEQSFTVILKLPCRVTWLAISLRTYMAYSHILWQEFVNIEGENKRRENEGGWACSLIISFIFQGETYEDTPEQRSLACKTCRKAFMSAYQKC